MKITFRYCKTFFYICLMSCICITNSHAGVLGKSGGLPPLLDKLGIASNVNKPEIWEDQLGGMVTGGSIHTRTPSSELQLLSMTPPSFNMSCGANIDLHMGGFGYINGKQLENMLKNIGINAASYLMMLSLKSLSPQVSDLLENLEAVSRFMNNQNINECNMGMSIAAAVLPKTQATQEFVCKEKKMSTASKDNIASGVSNFFTARYDCQDDATIQNANQKVRDDGLLGSEYNIVWDALTKEGHNIDKSDREFLMSLSGTLISTMKDGTPKLEHKASLIKESKLLNAIIFGNGEHHFNMYSCNDADRCLEPQIITKPYAKEQTMLYQVKELLSSMSEKIIQETAGTQNLTLSEKEKHLVSTSSIPILKVISINAGLKGHNVSITVDEYAESVTLDYVINYLDSLLDFVYKALSNLEHRESEGGKIKEYKEEIRFIKTSLFNERVKAFERLNTLLSVKEKARQIERMVLGTFGDQRQ